VWTCGLKAALRRPTEYYSVGAVGLSSVAFALQVGGDGAGLGPSSKFGRVWAGGINLLGIRTTFDQLSPAPPLHAPTLELLKLDI